jgi:hypothetical protein
VVNPIIKHLPLGLIIGYTTIWDDLKLPQNGWLMDPPCNSGSDPDP